MHTTLRFTSLLTQPRQRPAHLLPRKRWWALVLAIAALVLPGSARASTITVLTFEGLGNLEPVGDFYNGGRGPNYGVTFSSNALASIDADAGGTGNFGGEPSPSTVLFFLTGSAATLNFEPGFTTGFSFYYSAIVSAGFVNVWDGLNGTGNLLASLSLPLTPVNGAPDPTGRYSPFVPLGVTFSGLAKSVDFGGAQNRIGFDDITFGSATPGLPSNPPSVPDSASTIGLLSVVLMGAGLTRSCVGRWRRLGQGTAKDRNPLAGRG